jgi:hypothetical protein
MTLLKSKFFQVLERNLSLREFEDWLYSDDAATFMADSRYKEFFLLNYSSKSVGYEFSKLLKYFDLDEYALYKFENTLKQILADGNLFRIVRSCNDFYLRHDYILFGAIGVYDDELENEYFSYETARQELANVAEDLLLQWNALANAAARIAFLKGKIPVAARSLPSEDATYMRFSGRLWKFWKN